MNCHDSHESITRYATGELARESTEELEGHLADCPSCREELARALRLEEILEHGSRVTPPPGLVDRILTAVDRRERESLEREVVTISRERKIWLVRRDFLPSLSFALAAVFVSVGLGIWWPSFHEGLSMMIRGAAGLNVDFTVPKPAGGVAENLDIIIAGLMVLSSLCVVVSYTLPVRIRLRDRLMPF